MKKYISQWLVCMTLFSVSAQGYANVSTNKSGEGSPQFVSLDDVKTYVDNRGFVKTRKRDGILKLAGDVRARWIHHNEDIKNPKRTSQYKPLPVNRYRSEVHLYIDYIAEKSWLSSEMNWAAIAGGESTAAGLDIDRAFLGYRFYSNPETGADFFVEVGRTSLGDIFESAVQFNSNFDGIHLSGSRCISKCFPYNVTLHGGPFVVDMTTKHYAWAAEGVISQLPGDCTFRCSVIDWHTFSAQEASGGQTTTKPSTTPSATPAAQPAQTAQQLRNKYCVWQWLVSKRTQLPWFYGEKKSLYTYGAFLINTLAKASPTTLNKKENKGWFVGCSVGGIRKAGDWSTSLRYEYVEALSVPEIDVSGIGRGNKLKYWFAQAIAGGYDPSEANGFTNYQGFAYSVAYALTDSLTLRSCAAYSRPANDKLGSDFTFRKVDITLVSSF